MPRLQTLFPLFVIRTEITQIEFIKALRTLCFYLNGIVFFTAQLQEEAVFWKSDCTKTSMNNF